MEACTLAHSWKRGEKPLYKEKLTSGIMLEMFPLMLIRLSFENKMSRIIESFPHERITLWNRKGVI